MATTDTALFLTLLAANLLGVAMLVPQAVRTVRTRRLDGVSATWIGAGFGINLGWIVYAIGADVRGVLPVSIGSLVLYGAIAATMRRISKAEWTRCAAATLAVTVGLAALMAWGSLPALGLGLATLYTVQFAPAALTAVSSSRLDGLAPTTWAMSLAEAVLWLAYGLAIGDVAVSAGGAGAGVMSAVVVARIIVVGRTELHQATACSIVSGVVHFSDRQHEATGVST